MMTATTRAITRSGGTRAGRRPGMLLLHAFPPSWAGSSPGVPETSKISVQETSFHRFSGTGKHGGGNSVMSMS